VHVFGLCVTALITDVLQLSTGQHAPYWLAVCRPNLTHINLSSCEDAFILEDICSGPDPALISTGRQGTLPLDLSVCLSVRLYTCLSLGLPVSIPVCLYVSLSVALSVCLSDSIPVCLSVPVCLYNRLCLPFRLSISLLSSNNFISLYTCTHTNTHTQTKS
jgi:hypothetical protein